MKPLYFVIRALIYGLILNAYMMFFHLPFWPALGLIVLGDAMSILLRVAFSLPTPKKP